MISRLNCNTSCQYWPGKVRTPGNHIKLMFVYITRERFPDYGTKSMLLGPRNQKDKRCLVVKQC